MEGLSVGGGGASSSELPSFDLNFPPPADEPEPAASMPADEPEPAASLTPEDLLGDRERLMELEDRLLIGRPPLEASKKHLLLMNQLRVEKKVMDALMLDEIPAEVIHENRQKLREILLYPEGKLLHYNKYAKLYYDANRDFHTSTLLKWLRKAKRSYDIDLPFPPQKRRRRR
ncbi:hypothetical protein CCACVL1_03365 [Corchorus capsularis]|uniref:Uncharacterized protein n=1 Tax=Corchorus capsularis TaxID=210143 RepID=A0A1R3JZV8_COCAP|nr:hypothetical protein CCACVL1_03365 [Corchorus capsularis]